MDASKPVASEAPTRTRPRIMTKRFTVRLDVETAREVERIAKEDARNVGDMLRVLVGHGITWRTCAGSKGGKRS